MMMRFLSFSLAASLLLPLVGSNACSCTPTPPIPTDAAAVVRVQPSGDGFDVILESVRKPISSLQMQMTLNAGQATAVQSIAPVKHDLVEAGLVSPRSSFILVVSDTRQVPINGGALVHVSTTEANLPSITDGKCIDVDGAACVLAVGASE